MQTSICVSNISLNILIFLNFLKIRPNPTWSDLIRLGPTWSDPDHNPVRLLYLPVIYFTLLLSFVCFRNISLGVNGAWTRIGGMLSPQIFLLVSFLAFLCFMVREWKLWNMGEIKSHNLSTRLSTSYNNSVISSSCYKSLTTCWQIVEMQDDNKLLEQLVTTLLSSTTL
jgi:hypothetical protein